MHASLRAVARIVSLLALPAMLWACSTTPLTATSDYDRDYDFSPVTRFAILPVDRTTPAEKLISDLQVDRIESVLREELTGRGYTLVNDRADADLFLSWHLVTKEKTDIRAYNASSAYQCWRCGPPNSDVTVRQYTQGTFIVDFIDPLRNRSVWRSRISSRLKAQPDPQRSADIRARAAQAVLAPFPPAPGGAE